MTENEEKEVDSSFKDGVFQKKKLKIKKCIHFLLSFVNIFSLECLTGCLKEGSSRIGIFFFFFKNDSSSMNENLRMMVAVIFRSYPLLNSIISVPIQNYLGVPMSRGKYLGSSPD